MKKITLKSMAILFAAMTPFMIASVSLATTVTYDLTDLIGTYAVSNTSTYQEVVIDLGTSFTSIDSFTVDYWGEANALPLLTNTQGDIFEAGFTTGVGLLMEPFPQSGYGWYLGIAGADQVGDFYLQNTFEDYGHVLDIPSSQATFGIDFYFTGPYQYGETFYQDGSFDLTDVHLTINGTTTGTAATPTPEPATIFIFGSGLAVLAGFRKKSAPTRP